MNPNKIQNYFRLLSAGLLLASLGVACGDGGGSKGKVDAATDTEAPHSSANPAGGTFRELPAEVVLRASESATIYYTIDGSPPSTSSSSAPSPVNVTGISDTLRFFAVDQAGNQEVEQTESYTLDKFGPAPIDNFAAQIVADDVSLTWENPDADDFVDVVVARVPDVTATPIPADGSTPTVDDALPSGGKVVFVGPDPTAALSNQEDGNHTFIAWARYESGVFSEPRVVGARVAVMPQIGQITIDVAAQSVTVNTQPSGYSLAGSNVVFNAGALSFDMTATSTRPGIHFHNKMIVTAASIGTFSNPDGTVDDGGENQDEFRYFGPEGLLKGQSAARSIEMSGIAADSVVVVDVLMRNDPAVFNHFWNNDQMGKGLEISDFATGFAVAAGMRAPAFDNPTRADDNASWRQGGISGDGRYLFVGARSTNRVSKIDLSTMEVVAGIDVAISGEVGATSDVQVSASGRRAWVLLNDGMHTGVSHRTLADLQDALDRTEPANVSVHLVEVDLATMTEVSRITLKTSDNILYIGRRIGLSRDGRWAVIAAGAQYVDVSISELFLVDLQSGEIVDADDTTPELDPFDPQGLYPSQASFSHDGSKIIFNTSYLKGCDQVGLIDLATKEVTIHDYDLTTDCETKAINFLAKEDGGFYLIGEYPGLVSFDPSDSTFTTTGATDVYWTWATLSMDGSRIIGSDYGDIDIMTIADGVIERTVRRSGSSVYGHTVLATPF